MYLEHFLPMRLFRWLFGKAAAPPGPPQLLLWDTFADDRNGWVDATNRNPVLRQSLEQGRLCLDSSSPEMGVASSIASRLNGARDFAIEASLKVRGKGDLAYACLNFGIAKVTPGLRTIAGVEVATDLGDTKLYFGYSDRQEVLITKWHKGVETYYYRGYIEAVEAGAFNQLTIAKHQGHVSYAINGTVIFRHKAPSLPGSGVGVSVAPNAPLWVENIKVVN
jgi:hypothetical protein